MTSPDLEALEAALRDANTWVMRPAHEVELLNAAADYIERVEALVHDLALVLSRMVVGWEGRLGVDLAEHPEVRRVMAAYREWKVAS